MDTTSVQRRQTSVALTSGSGVCFSSGRRIPAQRIVRILVIPPKGQLLTADDAQQLRMVLFSAVLNTAGQSEYGTALGRDCDENGYRLC